MQKGTLTPTPSPSERKPIKFRQLDEEQKKKLIARNRAKTPNGIIVIAESHPRCKTFRQLQQMRFLVTPKDKIKEVDGKIKKKICELDKKFSTQSVFIFVGNSLLNREVSFEDLYSKHKNFQDQVLYLYFANVESF